MLAVKIVRIGALDISSLLLPDSDRVFAATRAQQQVDFYVRSLNVFSDISTAVIDDSGLS